MKKNEHNHFMPQTFRITQSGCSMVEMLGTLAIIGVLSVGAIGGYSYGMDKYRANQTVNDIMLRAIDLITQASQGRAELSFAEWEKERSMYPFGNPIYTADDLLTDWDETAWRNGKYTFTRNDLTKELYTKAFGDTGSPYIWMSDDYDSCIAFGVFLEGSNVSYFYRYRNHYNYFNLFAVCR